MRVVLDTNMLLSGLMYPHGLTGSDPCKQLKALRNRRKIAPPNALEAMFYPKNKQPQGGLLCRGRIATFCPISFGTSPIAVISARFF
jgi:hypothetical protein